MRRGEAIVSESGVEEVLLEWQYGQDLSPRSEECEPKTVGAGEDSSKINGYGRLSFSPTARKSGQAQLNY